MTTEQKVLLFVSGLVLTFAGNAGSYKLLAASIVISFWSLVVLPEYYKWVEQHGEDGDGGDDGKDL